MQLGMIGVGRMGANMARRLMRGSHDLVAYDVNPEAVDRLQGEGAGGSTSHRDFLEKLRRPRAIRMMVPVAIVDQTIQTLLPGLEPETS